MEHFYYKNGGEMAFLRVFIIEMGVFTMNSVYFGVSARQSRTVGAKVEK
jgi:hypothetical protein